MKIFDKKFLIFYGLLIAWRISTVCSIKGRVCHSGKPQFLPETAQDTTKRLADLRSLMSDATLTGQEGGVQAYIIPSSDPHQTEDVAEEHERREFISGFTGSHGTAIVTKNKAALWTDGRYFLQAEMELDCNWVLQKEGLPSTPKFGQWLKMNIPANSSVGVDPFLLSVCDWEKLSTKLKTEDIKLVPIKENLVDRIWTTRPTGNKKPIYVLGLQFTGMSWQDKVRDVRLQIQKRNVTAVVLQALDEIAWVFNLRGHDISYSPVFFSYSIITLNEAILFIDKQKVPKDVEQHLNTNLCSTTAFCVRIESYSAVLTTLQEMAKTSDNKIWITPFSSYALRMVIADDKYVSAASPVALPKAIKNDVEIQGMKNANIRDGVVISEFFAWLEREVQNQSPDLTEISAEEQLARFREQQDNFISLSFATISGFGANSAIIHYKANNFTKVQITDKGFYLLDTGAQYKDGTTDTTRTVHFGQPKQHEIDSYTRVLMGHIDIAMAVFPNDTHGRTLDVFAREPLWRVGLDYRHGTGHGIGHFLNVHEGPQCISPGFPLEDERVLTKGMILSDEPGYYEDGQFGVRIETAVLVESANTPYNFNKLEYLKFEPIALVPFQRKLINTLLMKPSQIAWLNEYHSRTRTLIGTELKRQGKIQTLQWLIKETQTIPLPNYKPTITSR